MGFRLVTLSGVIALMLHYFTDFDSFAAQLRHVVEVRPVMFTRYTLPGMFGWN